MQRKIVILIRRVGNSAIITAFHMNHTPNVQKLSKLMKKRFMQFTTLIMAVCMMVSLLCPAAHAAEDNVSPLVVSQGNRSIEYLPEENGYLLKNISAEEVFRAFDDDPYFVPVAATRSVAEQTASAAAFEQSALAVFEARGIDTTAARASTFEQDYYLPFSITGPDNSSVPAYFHACMKITTLSYDDVCCKRCISNASNTTDSQLICGTNEMADERKVTNGRVDLYSSRRLLHS